LDNPGDDGQRRLRDLGWGEAVVGHVRAKAAASASVVTRRAGSARAAGLALAWLAATASPGAAQAPYLVKDINVAPTGLASRNLAVSGGLLFFCGCDDYGCELWRSDGTASGTARVRDIRPGATGSNPGALTDVSGTLFFLVDAGRELWKSDGTEAGTVLVKTGFWAGQLTNVDGTLFFAAAADGSSAIWKSDGTEAGTVLVRSTWPGSNVGLSNLTAVGRTLFFVGTSPESGTELWRSDGTAAGTRVVLDIRAGADWWSGPSDLASVGGALYFAADDAVHGRELWRSDGTAEGTALVADAVPGREGSEPTNLVGAGDAVYFAAHDRANGRELWRSDGTAGGTRLVADVRPGSAGSSPSSLTSAAGTLFFTADDGVHGRELWRSDGTEAGTVLVEDIAPAGEAKPESLTSAGGMLFFVADDGTSGPELWRSDGTETGTRMPKETAPGGASPRFVTALGAAVLFVTGPFQDELWRSDGTEEGTDRVRDVDPTARTTTSAVFSLASVGGVLFFAADDGVHGTELWKSDGTPSGTVLLKDIVPGPASSWPRYVTAGPGKVFFSAHDGVHGQEPWVSDGTEAGTRMLKDLNPGPAFSIDPPPQFTTANGTVFFVAYGPGIGLELWKSDGTEEGTVLVKDVNPTGDIVPWGAWSWVFLPPVAVGGTIFFGADDGVHGVELWKSDGTAEGTVLVADMAPAGAWSGYSDPRALAAVDGVVYFNADDSLHGRELWRSDGTAGGTYMVRDVSVASSEPRGMTGASGTVLFGAAGDKDGWELWRTDGTNAGTAIVKDICPRQCSSGVLPVAVQRGALSFLASDTGELSTYVLWRSDGTPDGTVRVKDVRPGATWGDYVGTWKYPLVNGTLFLGVDDGVHGEELWTSDGTEDGTALVADIRPIGGSTPTWITPGGPGVFFVADDGVHGAELWAVGAPVDLSVQVDDGLALASPGQVVTYAVTVTNPGPSAVGGAEVSVDVAAALQDLAWSCVAEGGASCSPSGTGSPGESVGLPAESRVRYELTGTVSAAAAGLLQVDASVAAPPEVVDADPANDHASDVDVVVGATAYHTLKPCRLVDTRGPGAPLGGPALVARRARVFEAAGHCDLPPDARALAANVTVTGAGADGHLRILPTGQALPTTSTLNYRSGETRANNAVLSLDALGRFSVFTAQPPGTTAHLIVDVSGYFR
jgi:ELWxxDGT repeat protein